MNRYQMKKRAAKKAGKKKEFFNVDSEETLQELLDALPWSDEWKDDLQDFLDRIDLSAYPANVTVKHDYFHGCDFASVDVTFTYDAWLCDGMTIN